MNRYLLLGWLIVVGMYVGSYYAMVEQKMPRRINGSGIQFNAKYKFGGEWTSKLFEPMHEIDVAIRPSFWYQRFDLSDLFRE